MMKRQKIVIVLNLLVIAWLIILQTTKAPDTLENVDAVVYSADFFQDEKNYAATLTNIMTDGGIKASLYERPTSVYGLNAILSNSDCTYISSMGQPDGSIIELKQYSVYYRPDDVTKDMNGNLVFLSVCYGAKTNKVSGMNLCSTLVSKGYRAAIGYKGKVGVGECREFEKDFFYNWVVEKKCIINAFTAARDYVSSKYGSNNPVPATAAFFGNVSLKH